MALCEKYRGQPLPKPNVEPPPDLPRQTVRQQIKSLILNHNPICPKQTVRQQLLKAQCGGILDLAIKVFNGVSVNTASSLAATGILSCPDCQGACPAKRPCRCLCLCQKHVFVKKPNAQLMLMMQYFYFKFQAKVRKKMQYARRSRRHSGRE